MGKYIRCDVGSDDSRDQSNDMFGLIAEQVMLDFGGESVTYASKFPSGPGVFRVERVDDVLEYIRG